MSKEKTLRDDYPLREDYTHYSDDITPMLWAILIGAVLAQLIIWSLGYGTI